MTGIRALMICLLGWAAAALAQTTGAISGSVRTAAGDQPPVPNAAVVAKNTATAASYSARSAANGSYSLSGLPPGSYDLSVEVADPPLFLPFARKGLQLRAGQTQHLEIRLDDVLLNTLGDNGADFVKLTKPQAAPTGPAPRTREGKPDLSGLWLGALPKQTSKPELFPRAEALAQVRLKDSPAGPPSSRCLPMGITFAGFFGPTRLVQTPRILVIIDEDEPVRQIYLDGRGHPKDWNPSFMGHSIGRWEGDTLVVDTTWLNDQTWISFTVPIHTEMLHLIERYRRPDLGHLEVETTLEDPGAFKEPWTMKRVNSLAPNDGDVLEYVCEENERDQQHIPVNK
jgi:hypothetical protein